MNVVLAALLLLAQPPPDRLVDGVLAAVDGTPILASDLELVQRTGVAGRLSGGSVDLLWARVRLEAAYRDLEGVNLEADVEGTTRALIQRAGGLEALAAAGFDRAAVRRLARRVAVVQAYIQRDLRPRVEVREEEIVAAYRELAGAAGGKPPPLEQVRPQLLRLVTERELNRVVERWLADVLTRHRIEILRIPPVAGGP